MVPSFRRLFRFPWRTARQIEREVDEELQLHLELRAEELIESGLTPEAAREEAARGRLPADLRREQGRDVRGGIKVQGQGGAGQRVDSLSGDG